MKLVILSGAVCAGKTTVVRELMKKTERYFHLSYDSLKWQFSQYSSGKYYDDILALRLAMLRALCEMKYNVITESTLASTRRAPIDIVREHGYEVLEINLEADYDVLLRRCEERNAVVELDKVVSRERFDEVFRLYEVEKNPRAVTVRTDRHSVDEVVSAILKLL